MQATIREVTLAELVALEADRPLPPLPEGPVAGLGAMLFEKPVLRVNLSGEGKEEERKHVRAAWESGRPVVSWFGVLFRVLELTEG